MILWSAGALYLTVRLGWSYMDQDVKGKSTTVLSQCFRGNQNMCETAVMFSSGCTVSVHRRSS